MLLGLTTHLMNTYQTILNQLTLDKAHSLLKQLKANSELSGHFLRKQLQQVNLSILSVEEFIEILMRTKPPQIYAESAVYGDGSDWTLDELSILGDISIVSPVEVYDNGIHKRPDIHKTPFKATLVFTPGVLLRNDLGYKAADWGSVINNGEIDISLYEQIYERRLLPPLRHINHLFKNASKKALITIPGLGCGQFAGPFQGQLGHLLKQTLYQLIEAHSHSLKNIRAIYFDPYNECKNERYEIEHLSYLVRPLLDGNHDKPQLCLPEQYEEVENEFKNCELVSFVAWDHVSWPGNDFYIGSRSTDDGVKAAATNVMKQMTNVEGKYNPITFSYEPPLPFRNWNKVIEVNAIQLDIKDSIYVYE